MMLRPRQAAFVSACSKALKKHGNTLGVAPTGAGKSVMLAAIVERTLKAGGRRRALVLQHREELVAQNRERFHQVVGPEAGYRTGELTARRKDYDADVLFGMVLTVGGEKVLPKLPRLALIVIDEAHHTAAATYRRILDQARAQNPKVQILGVTATPTRSDGKALRAVFDNVGDQIQLSELILAGNLVRPRTFVIDLGVREQLVKVKMRASDFDMGEVERIMDHKLINDSVVEKWAGLAADRRTVVFTPTVASAEHLGAAFEEAGHAHAVISAKTPSGLRRSTLKAFEDGVVQVLLNAAVLTEGWDCPPCGCVVLTRPSSHKSVMIQMIGRGLRTCDPGRYGVVKKDCMVIDFGTAVLTHGSLEQDSDILGSDREPDGSKQEPKQCPQCQAEIPRNLSECPICGYIFRMPDLDDKTALKDFVLTEIDLLNQSPFRWGELFDGCVMVATAFEAWASCVDYDGAWHAFGGIKGKPVQHLMAGGKMQAVAAADDFMRQRGDKKAARKTKSWLNLPATPKQLAMLGMDARSFGLTRYDAACLLTWTFAEKRIKRTLCKS